MWVDDDGERYFTCQDLHDAGVTTYSWHGMTYQATCCPACHGWGAWRDHPAGLVIRHLPNRAWLICCCCWTFSRPDAWVVQKLNARR